MFVLNHLLPLSIDHQGNVVEDTIADLCCVGDSITFQVAGLRPSPAYIVLL